MRKSQSPYNEDLRQLEHLAPVGFAFLLKYLSWAQALGFAFGAVLYALLVSSRLFAATHRPDEARFGFSPGKLWYALSVFGLLSIFPRETHIVVAVWANLSVGDAVSNLLGRNFGKRALPWNSHKTWLGLSGAFCASSLAALGLILWNGFPARGSHPIAYAAVLALGTSFICSLVETLPLPVNDNITICLSGAGFLSWFTIAVWPRNVDWASLAYGLVVSSAAAAVASLLKTVSPSGALWGTLFGVITYFAMGLPGFGLLGTFFVLGSLLSKIGYRQKMQFGAAQADRGRRSGRHVWGKGFAAFVAALASVFLQPKDLACLAFTASLAAALSDTTATEIGQLLGRQPRLLATLQRVLPGTPGAVSFEGSALGLIAAGAIAMEAFLLHFVSLWGVAWAVVAAAIATHLEGYLVSKNPPERASGPVMNAFHTTVAMLIALCLSRIRI